MQRPLQALCAGLLGGLLLCAGCGERPRLRPLSDTAVILAFGDSLTAGSGVSDRESYPSVLAELTGLRVVNAGEPGEISTHGVRRLPELLRSETPDLVILCHGGNDLLRRQSEEQLVRNLEEMIALSKEAGAEVVLLGVPKAGLLLKSAPLYQQLAEKHNLPFDGATLPKILSTPALKSDPIHPNAAGYRQLAEAVDRLIRDSQLP
jgi:lysophospholipase L1-like esterase